MKALLALLCLLAFCVPARADYIYTYTGNTPQAAAAANCAPSPAGCLTPPRGSGSLTGWFEVPTQIFAVSAQIEETIYPTTFSFTDGQIAITNANALTGDDQPGPVPFQISTNADGSVFEWGLSMYDPAGDLIFSDFNGSSSEATDSTPNLFIEGYRGTWTITSVPESPVWLMSLAGMLALVLANTSLRRRVLNN